MRSLLKKLFVTALLGSVLCVAHAQNNDLRTGEAQASAAAAAPAANGGAESTSAQRAAQRQDEALIDSAGLRKAREMNLASNVFGANLFSGKFAKQSPGRFNPEYSLMIGDQVQVQLWGGYDYSGVLEVDALGNIFLPHVGPVKVAGVLNQDLQKVGEAAVRKIFRANVFSYISLAAPQPVRVFVGGFVHRPGLYNGTSMDSLLSYFDQAGGIDSDRGSFLNVQVKRGDRVRATIDLYEFLLDGRIPLVQLAEGDVIFVQPRQSTVKVGGLVANANRFEFPESTRTVADLMQMAKPKPEATHVRVVRNTGDMTSTEYYPLSKAHDIILQNGDGLEFTADKRPGTITVRVEGEHLSAQEYVLHYGARLGELMQNLRFYESSDAENIQLFRASVRERQKQMLNAALKNLETSVLTARSSTNEEARLRKDEAELMLQWIERARKVDPSGQVIVAQARQRDELLLENGDVIRVPKKDGLVLVSGEVVFPNAIAFESGLSTQDYIKRAGGYSQSADTSRIVVAHRDGSFEEVQGEPSWFGAGGSQAGMRPGDEILVLPKVQTKSIEVARGLMQIIYQIAIAAKVALDL